MCDMYRSHVTYVGYAMYVVDATLLLVYRNVCNCCVVMLCALDMICALCIMYLRMSVGLV